MQVTRNVVEIIGDGLLKWQGHLKWMTEERMSREIMIWKVEVKRREDKSRECWI